MGRWAAEEKLMDFLQPGSWDEALAVKAANPEAVPLAGGTDVMVELNFARRRPPALLDLNRVPELRGWTVVGDRLRVGAGVTSAGRRAGLSAERRAGLSAERRGPRRATRSAAAGAGVGRADSRLAPDSQPGDHRRQPGLGVARGGLPSLLARGPRRGGGWFGPWRPVHSGRGVLHRGQAER